MRLPRNECAESTQIITDLKGIIQWQATQNCSATWQWNISVELSHHIVLQLRDLYLPPRGPGQENDSLHIHGQLSSVTGTKVLDFRQSASVPMPPVFVRSNTVLVQLAAHGAGSMLELTFSSYPAQTLPPETSSGKYRCSSPFLVPLELQCDFVEQCEEGEDESRCSYSREGCNGWMPLDIFHCLTVVNNSVALTPTQADLECTKTTGANLAALYTPTEIKQVAKVFSLLGLSFVVVGAITVNAVNSEFQHLYRFLWSWDNNRVTFFSTMDLDEKDTIKLCVAVVVHPVVLLRIINCTSTYHTFACLKGRVSPKDTSSPSVIQLPRLVDTKWPLPLQTCPDGSLSHHFHPCSFRKSTSNLPSFMCDNKQMVHYSLTCDGLSDCDDGTDEGFCLKEKRSKVLRNLTYECTQMLQIIPKSRRCDGKADCHDKSDEERCLECQEGLVSCVDFGCSPKDFEMNGIAFGHCPHIIKHKRDTLFTLHRNDSYRDKRVTVKMNRYGRVQLVPMNQQEPCPETHVQCKDGPCIPSFLVQNGENDCPLLEDEVWNPKVNCSGYYRCYRYSVCLHPTYLCDGIVQCPYKDDEAYCQLTCPSECICEGLSLTCEKVFPAEKYAMARYLDLSKSENIQDLQELNKLTFLTFLNLSFCGLTNVSLGTGLHHLKVLDLSFNRLTSVSNIVLSNLCGLNLLILSNNPLFSSLDETLNAFMKTIGSRHLNSLVLANTGIRSIPEGNFSSFSDITDLDITKNPLEIFSRRSFNSFTNLKVLKTHYFTVCCFFMSVRKDAICIAPLELLSSCYNLVQSILIQTLSIIIAIVLSLGNGIVLVYLLHRGCRGSVKGPLVTGFNLSIADFCMGIYLIILLSADSVYRGEFDTYEKHWRESSACKVAGFLVVTSHMAKVLLLCLDTVSRLLVKKLNFHFDVRCDILLRGSLWGLSLVFAAVPLLWSARDWSSYSLTNTCVPYPIFSQNSVAYWYTFVLFVLFSWLSSMVVCCGQLYLFFCGHRVAFFSIKSSRRQDRRKPAVGHVLPAVVSSACCYAMVGLIAVLSAVGVEYYHGINILTVIFLLLSNSAVSPLLQIMILRRDMRHKRRKKSNVEVTLNRLREQIETWPLEALDQLIRDLYYVLTIMRKRERMELEYRVRIQQDQQEQENQKAQVLPNTSETQATLPKDACVMVEEKNRDEELLTTDDVKNDEIRGDQTSSDDQIMK